MSETKGFEGHAIVELLGHVRIAGFVTEETHFGAAMGRIDIPRPESACHLCAGSGQVRSLESPQTGTTCPMCNGKGKLGGGFTTQFFSGGSIYRLTPTTEEIARSVAFKSQPAPVSQWELPGPKLPAPTEAVRAGCLNGPTGFEIEDHCDADD